MSWSSKRHHKELKPRRVLSVQWNVSVCLQKGPGSSVPEPCRCLLKSLRKLKLITARAGAEEPAGHSRAYLECKLMELLPRGRADLFSPKPSSRALTPAAAQGRRGGRGLNGISEEGRGYSGLCFGCCQGCAWEGSALATPAMPRAGKESRDVPLGLVEE